MPQVYDPDARVSFWQMPFSTERDRLWYAAAVSTKSPQRQKVVYSEFMEGGLGPVASAVKGDSSETGREGAAVKGGGGPPPAGCF